MSVRIFTDSASDITLQEMEEKQIGLIAMPLLCGEKTYIDDKTIPMTTFWEMLLDGVNIKTSLPSPECFVKIFEEAKNKKEEVVCILISSGFSGTYQGAMLASFRKTHNCLDKSSGHGARGALLGADCLAAAGGVYALSVLRDGCAAAAEKQIAFYACELREKGMSGKEIAEELEKFRSRVRLIACLDTLEYLARGGRLPKTVAAIGNKLQFKPIITFTKEGEIEVVKKTRGAKKAMRDMAVLAEECKIDPEFQAIPLFSQDDTNCREYMATLQEADLKVEMKQPEEIGATIATYIGPEAYGIVFVES